MSSPPPPPPPPPRADSLVLLGVVVGRRNRSKRLAFFDLDVAGAGRGGGAFDAAEARSRVAAVVASASVDAPPPSSSASPPPPPLPSRVEIIAKTRAYNGGFEDDDALADARSRVLKLGNVVRARGRWTRRDDGEWSCACEGVELVSSWADANPGKHFSRAEEEGAAAAGGGGGGGGGGGAERRRDAPAASIDRTVVDDDDADPPPRPPCKFWLNQGVCHKGAACKYAHADDRGGRARAWIEARRARRRALAAEAGDPHGSDAVSKGKRAERFAEWLVRTFGVDALNAGDGVLDVAGGRGDVSFELYNRRGVKCTLVEPRARKLSKSQRKFLKNRPPSLGAADADAPLCAQVRAEFEPATWGPVRERLRDRWDASGPGHGGHRGLRVASRRAVRGRAVLRVSAAVPAARRRRRRRGGGRRRRRRRRRNANRRGRGSRPRSGGDVQKKGEDASRNSARRR